jgi:hypothetical protein
MVKMVATNRFYWMKLNIHHGGTETRRHGDTEARRHGDTETRRHGDTETRRHGDTEEHQRGKNAVITQDARIRKAWLQHVTPESLMHGKNYLQLLN